VKRSPEEQRIAAKRQRLMKFYRITLKEQAAIEEFQRGNGFSVLLEKGDPTETALLFTDHSHTSGLIRGRLAYLINKALGVFESSYKERTPTILRALAYYLENPPATTVLGEARYGIIGRAKQKKVMTYGSANGPLKSETKRKGKMKA